MKAGKAYLTSLGTTGLLLASSLLLLVVAGALFAYDRWPTGTSPQAADAVVIGAADRVIQTRPVAGVQQSRSRARRNGASKRRAARIAGRARRREARVAQSGAGVSRLPDGAVTSELPAPESASTSGPGTAAGTQTGGPAPGGARDPASAGGGGQSPSGLIDQVAPGIGADAGQAIEAVDETAGDALQAPLETLAP